jgi:hypothetical protein
LGSIATLPSLNLKIEQVSILESLGCPLDGSGIDRKFGGDDFWRRDFDEAIAKRVF